MIILPLIGGALVAGSIGLSVAVARKRLKPKDARLRMDKNRLLTLFLGQLGAIARWDSLKHKTQEQKRVARARIMVAASQSATLLGLPKTAAVLKTWISDMKAGTEVNEKALEDVQEMWPGTNQTVYQYLDANIERPTPQQGAV